MPSSRRHFLTRTLAGLSCALVASAGSQESHQEDGERLLVEIERRACRFFYEQADPETVGTYPAQVLVNLLFGSKWLPR